jgi:hypothetical protein
LKSFVTRKDIRSSAELYCFSICNAGQNFLDTFYTLGSFF